MSGFAGDACARATALAEARDHRLSPFRKVGRCYVASCGKCRRLIVLDRQDGAWTAAGVLLERACGHVRAGQSKVFLRRHPETHDSEERARWRAGQRRHRQRVNPTPRRTADTQPAVRQVIPTFPPPVPGTIALSFFRYEVSRCR